MLCQAYLSNNQPAQAIEVGERAVQFEKNSNAITRLARNSSDRVNGVYPRLLKNLVDAYQQHGDYANAVVYINLYITHEVFQSSQSRELADSYQQLAKILARQKRTDAAIVAGKQAIEMMLKRDYPETEIHAFGKWLIDYMNQNGRAEEVKKRRSSRSGETMRSSLK